MNNPTSSMEKKTVSACLIIIGNEILSGRTVDANLPYLAKALGEIGIQLAEARRRDHRCGEHLPRQI